MLNNIFLLKGKDIQNLNHLDIYSYPEDLTKNDHQHFIQTIIKGHEQNEYVKDRIKRNSEIGNKFVISPPIHQLVDQHNTYSISIDSTILIGLIFDKDDNPFDYKEIFEDLSNDLLNAERCCFFEDEIEIENFLITLFIDIRRYGDEILGQYTKIAIPPSGISSKIFLFGIDNVGKSSFVRRVKTGQYNDNYFPPTRTFNIEYIQNPNGVYSFWDMAGQSIFREKWLKGIQDSNIIIYMIDVANQIRFEEAKNEFWNIFDKYNFQETPLLIIGNKIDLINRSEKQEYDQLTRLKTEIVDFFEFNKLSNLDWKFIFTSVKTNYNIDHLLNIIYNYT